ncbi:hypothetical protein QI3_1728 [Clostridioides difficile 842]|nr:hypothetical protein QC1_1773 [Clostridioides difficile CD21]EQE36547.1 hypothetical protein QC7_1854 [Clostridioides difficile CD38]EQE49032.1 hypothetical protein QC9_1705 [Clostridioides difficile CD39]EQE76401.1 hypothetical protein QCQ_1847 [Clostridioides difficile CD49]EQE96690.1 hypothetical protein QEA_1844 [Clostridioides difficile CD109]EQE97358.1 hypothetical protein QCY_1734 [Clostridioides difficile CD70]EQF15460.1 hypothetical protein QEQ_1761 [Clostridioides difficile CD144
MRVNRVFNNSLILTYQDEPIHIPKTSLTPSKFIQIAV